MELARNITQGREVRQTVRLNSSGRIKEIRKKRFNLLGVIYKGKGTRLFTVQGCFSILIVLFTKLSSPNLT